MSKRNTLAGTVVAGVSIMLAMWSASPAFATDTPDTYGTLHWQVDNPASIWQVPQHDPVWVSTGAVVDLTAGRDQLACGRHYQSDGEIDGPITTALYAGGAGLLYGPGNPEEAHAYGAPGTNGDSPWTYWDSPDCMDEPVCTDEFHQTVTSWRWVWDEATQGVIRSDTSVSLPIELTEAEAIAAGCYVPPTDPETPVDECGTADTLACTGVWDWLLWVGLGLAAAGSVLVVGNWMFGRVHKGRNAV